MPTSTLNVSAPAPPVILSEAEKFIKWYKTGDMKGTKDVKVVKEEEDLEEDLGVIDKFSLY